MLFIAPSPTTARNVLSLNVQIYPAKVDSSTGDDETTRTRNSAQIERPNSSAVIGPTARSIVSPGSATLGLQSQNERGAESPLQYYVVQLARPLSLLYRVLDGSAVLFGIWSEPAQLPCEGFDAPHVFSEFHEPTPFYGHPVCDSHSWETQCAGVFAAGSLADPGIDIVLRLREQATTVVRTIAGKLGQSVFSTAKSPKCRCPSSMAPEQKAALWSLGPVGRIQKDANALRIHRAVLFLLEDDPA